MIKDIFEYLDKKSSSTVVFIFIIFWIICHHRVLTVIFFVDQNLIYQDSELLKNEYIEKQFLNYCDWVFWIRALLPFILTAIYIWVITRFIINKAYKRQIKDKTERDLMKQEAQRELMEKQREVTEEGIKTTKAQVRLVNANKELENKTPEKKWEKEYEEFIKLKNHKEILIQLRKTIYDNYGNIHSTIISGENLMICDTNNLVDISGNKCVITQKGKYFLSRLFNDSNR